MIDRFVKRIIAILVPLIAVVFFSTAAAAGSSRSAAVAMPDTYSAVAARKILEAGGNAVDASIAAAFVLAVTLPEAGNIGGGRFHDGFRGREVIVSGLS